MNLKGKVMSITERYHEGAMSDTGYTAINRISVESAYIPAKVSEIVSDGFYAYESEINFNDKGFINEISIMNSDVPLNIFRNIFRYDEKNRLSEIIGIYAEDIFFNEKFEYEGNKKVLRKLMSHRNIIEEQTYEYSGKTTKSTLNLIYDDSDYTVITSRDEKNRPTEEIIYFEGDVVKTTYKYNSKGLLIESCSYDSSDEPFQKETFLYDDKNNEINHTAYDIALNEISAKWDYIYKYDKYGNWIEQIQIINDNLYAIVKRDIVYYRKP